MVKINWSFVILFVVILSFNGFAYGQQPYAQVGRNFDYMIGAFGAGSPASTARFGEAAVIESKGNFLLRQSEANINNQVAYEHALRNDHLKTETYFGKRQSNRFYSTLEDWQQEEKTRIKRTNGRLTREDIYHIYGR